MPSVVIWLVDDNEKFQLSVKVEHIDDCEQNGMHVDFVAWVDDDSGELGEIGADVKVVA